MYFTFTCLLSQPFFSIIYLITCGSCLSSRLFYLPSFILPSFYTTVSLLPMCSSPFLATYSPASPLPSIFLHFFSILTTVLCPNLSYFFSHLSPLTLNSLPFSQPDLPFSFISLFMLPNLSHLVSSFSPVSFFYPFLLPVSFTCLSTCYYFSISYYFLLYSSSPILYSLLTSLTFTLFSIIHFFSLLTHFLALSTPLPSSLPMCLFYLALSHLSLPGLLTCIPFHLPRSLSAQVISGSGSAFPNTAAKICLN